MVAPHQHTVFFVATAVSAVGAAFDWRKGEIPNWLTIPVIVLAPVVHILRFALAKETMDSSLAEGAYGLAGAALCAVVPLLLFRQGAIAGGDVKLFVALGALLEPLLGVEAQLYGFVIGAVFAPAKLAYEGRLVPALRSSFAIGSNFFLPKARQRSIDPKALSWFRLGPAIFLGVVLTSYVHW
jgi:prepilin peptidase CpaA